MRFNLALSLLISLILIGTASWSRFVTAEYVQPNIVAVGPLEAGEESYEEIVNGFLKPETTGTASTSPTETLSNTDIIGRGLIMDYIGLAANGQATEANIINLANQYVESVPNFNKATVLKAEDIKTVSNTKANFQKYSDTLTIIYKEYADGINKVNAMMGNLITVDSTFYSTVSDLNTIYTKASFELREMSVPMALLSVHLELLNSYLSNAAATEAISKTTEDSTSAFAGLIALNENVDEEIIILNEIDRILTSNGI